MRIPVRQNLRRFVKKGVKSSSTQATNGNINTLGFTLGVNFADLQMTSSSDGVNDRGTYYGAASRLIGQTFRAPNGAVIGISAILDQNIIQFITTSSEADVRAGFEYPAVWEHSNIVVMDWDDALTWDDNLIWGDYIGGHAGN